MDERRETSSGYHLYGTFRDCPRKFYLQYILGLKPALTGSALIFGACIHEAIAALWQGQDPVEVFEIQMKAREKEYESLEKFQSDLLRGPHMIQDWIDTWWTYDNNYYELLGVEQLFEVPFGPDPDHQLIFTVRLDRIYKNKQTGEVHPVEMKTTGWGVDKMFSSTAGGDQITAQIWALNKMWPQLHCNSAIVDVLYNKGSVYKCQRPGIVYRSKESLQIFEMGMYATITEITRKYKALLQGIPWPLTFMPHKNYCRLFGCPYELLCDTNVQAGTKPPGFLRDDWIKDQALEALEKSQNWDLNKWKLEGERR